MHAARSYEGVLLYYSVRTMYRILYTLYCLGQVILTKQYTQKVRLLEFVRSSSNGR